MKTGRNEACPCGSGVKFKRCCLGKSAAVASYGTTAAKPAGLEIDNQTL
jgi:hypothetical protein